MNNQGKMKVFRLFNRHKLSVTICLCIFFWGIAHRSFSQIIINETVDTSDIYIPDAKTAVRIAEIVMRNEFGSVKKYRPFKVTLLENRYWYIEGTFPYHNARWCGGVPMAKIDKYTGMIIYVTHSK